MSYQTVHTRTLGAGSADRATREATAPPGHGAIGIARRQIKGRSPRGLRPEGLGDNYANALRQNRSRPQIRPARRSGRAPRRCAETQIGRSAAVRIPRKRFIAEAILLDDGEPWRGSDNVIRRANVFGHDHPQRLGAVVDLVSLRHRRVDDRHAIGASALATPLAEPLIHVSRSPAYRAHGTPRGEAGWPGVASL
jgi:hypothetical protein